MPLLSCQYYFKKQLHLVVYSLSNVLCSAIANPVTNYNFLTFLWSVYLLCKPPYYKPRCRSHRPPWKRVKKFRRRRLHNSLVQRCRRCHGQPPCRLHISYFPSPHCAKHRRWRRRKTMARARHKRLRIV